MSNADPRDFKKGAFGYFECTKSMSDLTKANFLQSAGSKTPIFIRFSTVTLGREFPDSARNPRGFAIKFYTGEGNYDIVGLNWVMIMKYKDVGKGEALTYAAHLLLPRPHPRPGCHPFSISEPQELPS